MASVPGARTMASPLLPLSNFTIHKDTRVHERDTLFLFFPTFFSSSLYFLPLFFWLRKRKPLRLTS